MNQPPHRNDDRFYGYPKHRIVAIVPDEPQIDTAVKDLDGAGLDVSSIHVLSGPAGARLLDRSGKRNGFAARALRLLQGGAFETDALRVHEQALNGGHHVIFVPVRGDDARRRVTGILRAAGGHSLLYFGAWSIAELRF